MRIYTAFTPYGIPAFSGAWRSVGSPPPDTAVWGRPSYVLPVRRDVIITTTERILTGPVYGSIPPNHFRNHHPSGARSVWPNLFFYSRLDIPMAVTDVGKCRSPISVDAVGMCDQWNIAYALRTRPPGAVGYTAGRVVKPFLFGGRIRP